MFSARAQNENKDPFGQENEIGGGNGSMGGTGNKKFSDSIPIEISERIYTYLEGIGINEKHKIANFDNQYYTVVAPLKKEQHVLIIWAVVYFDAFGNWKKTMTRISDIQDVDCEFLRDDICKGIENLKIGYERKYNSTYESGTIGIFELPGLNYFEVEHNNSDSLDGRIYIKFDFEGEYVEK